MIKFEDFMKEIELEGPEAVQELKNWRGHYQAVRGNIQMHRTIVIFEFVPEQTMIYDLIVDAEQLSKLQLCHGHFLNTEISEETEEALTWLSRMISPETDDADAGEWEKFLVYDSNDDTQKCITLEQMHGKAHIIITGFIL